MVTNPLSNYCGLFKGTANFKMCEIDRSHVKETSFTCSLVKLVIVLEYLKDRAFDSADCLR